jgi:hypothetical protein
MLIGITGKARSGKDAIAKYLYAAHGFTRIAFADPLKMAAQSAFGLTNEQTWSDDLKEVVIDSWGLTPRRIFQLFGNEAMKPVFGDDHWINRWIISANTLIDDDIVVPDVRFEHEAAMIRRRGGIIVHVHRPAVEGLLGAAGAHSSEAGIDFRAGDFRIDNNGTLENLASKVDVMLHEAFSCGN